MADRSTEQARRQARRAAVPAQGRPRREGLRASTSSPSPTSPTRRCDRRGRVRALRRRRRRRGRARAPTPTGDDRVGLSAVRARRAVLAALALAPSSPRRRRRRAPRALPRPDERPSPNRRTPVVAAVEKVRGAVVNVSAEELVRIRVPSRGELDGGAPLRRPLRAAALPAGATRSRSLGSGVIVSPDGLRPHEQPRRRARRALPGAASLDGRELAREGGRHRPVVRPRGAEARDEGAAARSSPLGPLRRPPHRRDGDRDREPVRPLAHRHDRRRLGGAPELQGRRADALRLRPDRRVDQPGQLRRRRSSTSRGGSSASTPPSSATGTPASASRSRSTARAASPRTSSRTARCARATSASRSTTCPRREGAPEGAPAACVVDRASTPARPAAQAGVREGRRRRGGARARAVESAEEFRFRVRDLADRRQPRGSTSSAAASGVAASRAAPWSSRRRRRAGARRAARPGSTLGEERVQGGRCVVVRDGRGRGSPARAGRASSRATSCAR